ncbi:MAG: hypothetical protein H6511_07845 [Holophagales bacterium]|nr:hypothetical protein [Holophagales bacterium]
MKPRRAALLLALLLPTPLAAAEEPPARPTASLRTVEGEVVALHELPGEGELPVVAVDLAVAGEGEALRVLLAPRGVLEEIDFPIETGDRIRVRIFADRDGTAYFAQRVLNETRSALVRLRTLRQEPLWNASGSWRGGDPSRGPGRGPGGRRGPQGGAEGPAGPPR